MEVRMKAIGNMIEKFRPAVIGFQEVTQTSLEMLRAQPWAKHYDCSIDIVPPFSTAYFVVIFSALPVLSWESLPFSNTGMGRELLCANVEVTPGYSLLVATSHLESMPESAHIRIQQLRESLDFLSERVVNSSTRKSLGAVFMGDTNLLRTDMKLMDPQCIGGELMIESAKTGRSRCRHCRELIDKDELRIGKVEKDRVGSVVLEICKWSHQVCFLQANSTTKEEKEEVAEYTQGPSKISNDRSSLGLPPRWRDLWLSVANNSERNGYTYDGQTNGLIKNRSYRSRFDRMYLYSGSPLENIKENVLEKIELVGKEPIMDGLWPSDHYALLSTFCFDPCIIVDQQAQENPKRRRVHPTCGTQTQPIEIE